MAKICGLCFDSHDTDHLVWVDNESRCGSQPKYIPIYECECQGYGTTSRYLKFDKDMKE